MKIRLHPFGLAALFLLLASPLFARQRAQGDCSIGGNVVVTTLVASTTKVMQSFPLCTVTVYLTGITPLTLATLYSDNLGTVLANPFTATNNGHWYFYADNGHYDARISGAGIPSAFTFGDILLADGTSGAAVSFNGCIAASQYAFPPQNPGGTLTAAITNVVTLATVPIGVNGTDTGHWLYISGGSGTAEAVLITGGTAVSGATTGTITFVPANNHSGNWAIQTATAGIEETLWTLPATGGDICVAPGDYTMYGPYNKRAIPVYLHGAGMAVTVFHVATTFPSSAVGVFAIPDDSPLIADVNPGGGQPTYTAFRGSGGFSDFSVFFVQPDSQSIAAYTHWPPAIFGNWTNRIMIQNFGCEAAWDCIKLQGAAPNSASVNGTNGPVIDHLEMSFFHNGISLDNFLDSLRISNDHNWVFGLTLNQNYVMIWHPAVQSFYIGRVDDLHIRDYAGFNFGTLYTSANGNPWVECDNCEADSGGITITSAGGFFTWIGGHMGGTSGTVNGVTYYRIPITWGGANQSVPYNYNTLRGGSTGPYGTELRVSHVTMGWGPDTPLNSVNAPDVDMDCSNTAVASDQSGPYALFSENRHFITSDHHVIYAHSGTNNTCTFMLNGERFNDGAGVSATLTNSIIHKVGPVRISAHDNVINDKVSGTGVFFLSDTDMVDSFTNNTASNWTITVPATYVNSIVKDNVGITNPITYSTPVPCTSQLQPTGERFHLTGTCIFSTIFVTNLFGPANQGNVFHEFWMIMDGNDSWDTQGNLISPGSGTAGKLYHWVYDPSLTKWYVIN